jgi:hypothetical protein
MGPVRIRPWCVCSLAGASTAPADGGFAPGWRCGSRGSGAAAH